MANLKTIFQPKIPSLPRSLLLFQAVLTFFIIGCLFRGALWAGEVLEEDLPSYWTINPHWSAKHCRECHLDELPEGKGAALRFDGDPQKLCSRCHKTEDSAIEIHPVEVPLVKEMKADFPQDWPLHDGKLSCLTCHDSLLQMTAAFSFKKTNPKFLRGWAYGSGRLRDFCFTCHQENEYQKTSPHKQLDEQGNVLLQRCLFCHRTLPDPKSINNIEEVTFKSALTHYCINCHPQQKKDHPARADHNIKLPDSMKASLSLIRVEVDVELPLDGDTIFCGTCHNPHEKGVIRRKAALQGAGEKFFLRLNGGYELCVACHSGKKIKESSRRSRSVKEQPGPAKMILSLHKPMAENKCKVCHVITPENRQKPPAIFLCFKAGCHKPALIEKEFAHGKSIGVSCYLCHRHHVSVNRSLLRTSVNELCRACHPHLRNKGNQDALNIEEEATATDAVQASSGAESIEIHTYFNEYLRSSPVPAGKECGFCHSPYHKAEINNLDLETCSGCHSYVQNIMSRSAASPVNIHQEFAEKNCSSCHDPHSAKNKQLLRLDQDIRRYRKIKPKFKPLSDFKEILY